MGGITRFQDLVTWPRLFELSVEVWTLTAQPPACRDFQFRDQIRDASDSAQRNVAEGFGRFDPPQFLYFLSIARASALETQALLRKGLAIGYISRSDFERLDALADHGLQALAKCQRYLRSPEAKRNAQRRGGPARPGTTNPNNPNNPNDPNHPNHPNVPNDPNNPTDPTD